MPRADYTCYYISPIGEPSSDIRKNTDLVMSLLIYPALSQCGFSTENIVRSDQLHTMNIQEGVITHLEKDHLCVVDITGYNPNVMFEYGYRKGLGKALIAITSDDIIPIDIHADRIIRYDLKSPDALSKLPNTIDTIRRQVQSWISQGFFASDVSNDIADMSAKLAIIEKKLDDVLSRSSNIANYTESDLKVNEIVNRMGSPIAAFNYALHGRDVALVEALLPRLEATLPKARYIDEAVATAASIGSSVAASILKNEWSYITEELSVKQRYEELGAYVTFCNQHDCELENIDFVLAEANKLLEVADEEDEPAHFKAGVYNQINRICFGAYQTKKKSGINDSVLLDKAIDALQKAVELFPNEPAYYFNLATCFREKGDRSSAVTAIEKCLNLNSNDEGHLVLAYKIFEENEMGDKARKVKDKLQNINPLRASTLSL